MSDDKDIFDTDEDFIGHCKEATRHLTAINNRLHEDDELTSLESLSFMVTLISVNCLGDTLSDAGAGSGGTASDFKWDDDHTFE